MTVPRNSQNLQRQSVDVLPPAYQRQNATTTPPTTSTANSKWNTVRDHVKNNPQGVRNAGDVDPNKLKPDPKDTPTTGSRLEGAGALALGAGQVASSVLSHPFGQMGALLAFDAGTGMSGSVKDKAVESARNAAMIIVIMLVSLFVVMVLPRLVGSMLKK